MFVWMDGCIDVCCSIAGKGAGGHMDMGIENVSKVESDCKQQPTQMGLTVGIHDGTRKFLLSQYACGHNDQSIGRSFIDQHC
jgi:hypothetical protein